MLEVDRYRAFDLKVARSGRRLIGRDTGPHGEIKYLPVRLIATARLADRQCDIQLADSLLDMPTCPRVPIGIGPLVCELHVDPLQSRRAWPIRLSDWA